MKKNLMLAGAAAVAGLLIAGIIIGAQETASPSEMKGKDGRSENLSTTQKISGISDKVEVDQLENDSQVLATLHKMTHQKVAASEKWGAIEMTEENINEALTAAKSLNIRERAWFIDMVERWKAGDFSSIVEDHNMIWEYQGGSIGKAVDALSPSEEQKFIKNNFR